MKELVEKRQENSKAFKLDNGKRQLVVSIGAIHYRDNYADKTEQWKHIDLTWEGNRITKAPYELTHEGNKLTLKNKRTNNITTIELLDIGGKKIPDVAWERSRGLARAPGITTIEDVVLDTDLEVIAEFSAVRFRRILKSDKAPQEAKFKVTGDTSLIRIRASDEDGDIPIESSLKDGILTETLKPDRAVKYPVKIDPTWQVGASSDDCHVYWDGSIWNMNLTAAKFTVGYEYSGLADNGGGMRFQNVTIPQGARIDIAYLTFISLADEDGTTVRTRITGENVDNAATWSTLEDYQARRGTIVGGGNDDYITAAQVNWDNIPAWTLETSYNSPSIISVIQEIVNRIGWASGNALALWWDDHDSRTTTGPNHRDAYSYEGSTPKAPKLVIEYTPPPGLENKSANMGSKMVAAGLI